MALPPTPAGLLDAAVRADPARALLTYYDDATGERAELSVTTFATWVAKTAGLARDEIDLHPGDRVALALPLHWQAAVWLQACWLAGLEAVPVGATSASGSGRERPGSCAAAVVALDGSGGLTADDAAQVAPEVVGLGLGPLGLPRPGPRPASVTVDFDAAVPGAPDHFVPDEPDQPDRAALDVGGVRYDGAALVAAAGERVARDRLAAGERLLTTAPYTDLASVVTALLAPLASGASVVLARNATDEALWNRRLATERVTAVTAGVRFGGASLRRLD